jgi:hypothetical protein
MIKYEGYYGLAFQERIKDFFHLSYQDIDIYSQSKSMPLGCTMSGIRPRQALSFREPLIAMITPVITD